MYIYYKSYKSYLGDLLQFLKNLMVYLYKRVITAPSQLKKKKAPSINVRPYRYPYYQKIEIENIIRELLEFGTIIPIQSTFHILSY